MSQDDRQRNHNNRKRILHNHSRIYHHTNRYKKYRTKKIFHRLYQSLDTLRFHRFGKNGAHNKCPEGRRETSTSRHNNHTETQTKRNYEQSFFTHQLTATLQQFGYQVDADNKPKYQEKEQLPNALQHFRPLKIMPHRHSGQHHHQDNSKNVFEYQHTEHQSGKLFLAHSQIIKCFINDSGGRHSNHPPQEDTIHALPAKACTDSDSEKNHAENNGTGSNDSRSTHFDYFFKAKFQT